MIRRFRFIIVFSLILGVGAVQYALPYILNVNEPSLTSTNSTLRNQSSFKIDVSYESTTEQAPDTYVNDYQWAQQGSLFLQEEGQNGYLLSPLLDTKVNINVTGLVARATVTQKFTNTRDEWVNGIYVFPLPDNAAVDHLEMRIGNRVIEGQVQPKQKAKAIYEAAKRSGKKASLLVQQRPNLFKNSVANIGPGESIIVTIEYQQAVRFDNNRFSLRFPTTITERYLPKSDTEGPAEIANNGWDLNPAPITQPAYTKRAPHGTHTEVSENTQPLNKVALTLSLNTGFALHDITSEFHPINQHEVASGHYEVSLQQDMIANQDFVLHWQPSPSVNVQAAHFTQPLIDKQSIHRDPSETEHYGMIMLMPPTESTVKQTIPREVVFVIDTSGSMGGESIVQAQRALALAIKSLPVTDTFNIVQFDSTAARMWTSAQTASHDNKRIANDYIDQLTADGGTEMLSALQLALAQQSDNGKIRQVIFITDGAVGNEEQLFGYIRDNLRHSRLFTVGIGSAPNSHFMTQAAQMGKGTFTYIGSVDSVQSEMQVLFDKLTHPVLSDLTLNFSDDVEVYPRNLPDIYRTEPIMISYKAKQPLDNLVVTGNLSEHYWQKTLSLNSGAQRTGLNVLWARRKIAQLTRDKRFGADPNVINQLIEQVAMRHHLVSEMTSLVAIDVTPTALATSADSQVNNQAPKGQKTLLNVSQSGLQGTLPNTATAASLHRFMGIFMLLVSACAFIIVKRH